MYGALIYSEPQNADYKLKNTQVNSIQSYKAYMKYTMSFSTWML
jgi:hypothetical protein